MLKKINKYFNNTIDKANVDDILFTIEEELKSIKVLNRNNEAEEINLKINMLENNINKFRLDNNIGYYE